MKRSISGPCARVFICALLACSTAGLQAQTTGLAQETSPAPPSAAQQSEEETFAAPKSFSLGLRVRTFPLRGLSVMDSMRSMTTVTSAGTIYDQHSARTSDSASLGAGPVIEIGLGQKVSLRVELLYTRLGYDNVADAYSGTDDPTTAGDERSHATLTENTKAKLWDLPVMLQYRRLRPSGLLSRMYLAGGVTARNVSSIVTSTEITNADSTTATSSSAASPQHRNLLGGVVGIGFRFIDDFRIQVTPEVRYTRWTGGTFPGSPKNQLEVGIGISY